MGMASIGMPSGRPSGPSERASARRRHRMPSSGRSASAAGHVGTCSPAATMRAALPVGCRRQFVAWPAAARRRAAERGGVKPAVTGAGSAGAVSPRPAVWSASFMNALPSCRPASADHDGRGGHQDRLAARFQQIADPQRLHRAADVGFALLHVGLRGGGLRGAPRRGDEIGLAGIGFARPDGLAALVAHAPHDRVEVGPAGAGLERTVGELRIERRSRSTRARAASRSAASAQAPIRQAAGPAPPWLALRCRRHG